MAHIKVGNEFVDIDILALLEDYGIKGKQIGIEYLAPCPFHDDSSPSWSMRISGEKAGAWQCFSSTCEAKGHIVQLIMRMENCGYREAIASLVTETSVAVKPKDQEQIKKIIEKLLNSGIDIRPKSLKYSIPDNCSKTFVKEFFTNNIESGGRGYNISDFTQLKTGDIKYCEGGFFRNKIIIPIYNEGGEQISFVARNLDPRISEKYRYPRGWTKTLFIYKIEADEKLPPILCEGIFDGLHVAGIWKRTALITFGSAISVYQCSWVAKRYDKVVFAYDADTSGKAGTYHGIKRLQQYGVDSQVLMIPEGFDPPMVSKDIFQNLTSQKAEEYKNKWERIALLKK